MLIRTKSVLRDKISTDCTALKSQLKTYDLVGCEGLSGSKDDTVASLLNALHPIDKNAFYRKARGLPMVTANGSSSLVAGKLQTIASQNSSDPY